ncbi:MAG: hypothetical protein R3C10_15310 [Pirellulales bacterium]
MVEGARSSCAVGQRRPQPRQGGPPGPAGQPLAQPGDAKPADNKPAGEQPAGEQKGAEEAKPGGDSGPVKRPEKPSQPADPAELKVRPDDDGKISFVFKGQPWADVLEWLADISQMSLEWQELPSGYLNLRARERCTPSRKSAT